MAPSHGTCDDRFRRVREIFDEILARPHELGAALAVVVDGVTVLDLWGGFADGKKTKAWEANTLVNMYSTTKGLTAMCAHRLVDEGRLDLDAPLATIWPELGAAADGKELLTLRHALSHQAGLSAFGDPIPDDAIYDFDAMTKALERQKPWWTPGTSHGYHPFTFGWLVGEAIRRAAGAMPGDYLRETITSPLGADVHVGLPASEDGRCAELRRGKPPVGELTMFDAIMSNPTGIAAKAFSNPMTLAMPESTATRAWRGAQIPGVNAHGTARGVATVYGALATRDPGASPTPVLSRDAIRRCAEEQVRGPDLVLDKDTRFGLGFMLPQAHDRYAADGSFGHPGAGGSLGYADPDAGIGFGFTVNRMGTATLCDPRAIALSHAVYESLGASLS